MWRVLFGNSYTVGFLQWQPKMVPALSSCSTRVIRSSTSRSAFCQILTGMLLAHGLIRIFLRWTCLCVNNSRSALSTLMSIHHAGILHGDICLVENVPSWATSGVMIINFSHSKQCDDQGAMDEEYVMVQLCSLLGLDQVARHRQWALGVTYICHGWFVPE